MNHKQRNKNVSCWQTDKKTIGTTEHANNALTSYDLPDIGISLIQDVVVLRERLQWSSG
jgi:hypothetical protein